MYIVYPNLGQVDVRISAETWIGEPILSSKQVYFIPFVVMYMEKTGIHHPPAMG